VFDQCLASRDVNSAVCERAQAMIGFSDADFQKADERYLAEKDSSDFATYFEKCLASRDITSEKCAMAFQLSHMSAPEFKAKFDAKLAAKTESDAATYFRKCVETRDLQSERCRMAIKLSGLSEADFRAKFEAALSGKSATPTLKSEYDAAFAACVASRDFNSDACIKALALSGLSDEVFRQKVAAAAATATKVRMRACIWG